MNKITILGLLMACFPLFSTAQITILDTDMAQIGDVISRNVDTLATVSPGSAGANQQWLMTNATVHLTENTSVIAPSATPYANDFPGSNLVMTNDNASFLYFSQNTSTLYTTGIAGDLLNNGSIIKAPFNSTLLVNNFPRTYGSNFTDPYGLDVTTSGTPFGVNQVRYKRASIALDSTDGWGELTTPVGTYNALRVKHVEYIKDSIWVQLFPFAPFSLFQNTKDTTTSYTWLAKETKLAVAELTLDSVGNPKKYTWSLIPPAVGIEKAHISDLSAKMYPMPAAQFAYLTIGNNENEGQYQLEMYSLQGQLLFSQELNMQVHKPTALDVSAFMPGTYIWYLKNNQTGRSMRDKLIILR